MILNGRYALDCRIDASFGAQYKNFNEDRPILSVVRWATKWNKAAKIDNFFYRMQCHFSDILNSNDTKTGDFERHLRLFNVAKLHWPRGTHIVCCACYAF